MPVAAVLRQQFNAATFECQTCFDLLRSYYYNIDTQRSQQEHPNMMHVGKAIVAKLEEHKARLKVISDIVVVVIVVVVILQQ